MFQKRGALSSEGPRIEISLIGGSNEYRYPLLEGPVNGDVPLIEGPVNRDVPLLEGPSTINVPYCRVL